MIIKDKFLEWCRIEFAISAELERDFRHPLRFPSGVDSKSVGFPLGHTHDRVQKWSHNKNECAQDQDEQGKPGRIGNAANAPFVSPAPHSGVKKSASKRESREDNNSGISQQFRAVIEHIVTHLVR